ncbi:MAG: glycerol-3-phosphate acyltransferase [Trueperaceae bacterium]|nr:glycerol-3-phosphate acyltransferase [Trueperaceae bacterium]
MEYTWLIVAPLVAAYLIGSVPLGAWLVRAATGFDPREVNPHLLGVENVYRLVGAGVAVASFVVDLLKGMTAVVLGVICARAGLYLAFAVEFGFAAASSAGLEPRVLFTPGNLIGVSAVGAPLIGLSAASALVGAVIGHLYPIPLRGFRSAPRGRGNGVMLGGLGALFALGSAPFWALSLPVVVYAVVLALTGYVALGTVAGVLTLGLGAVIGAAVGLLGWEAGALLGVLAVLVMWRHKSALSRIRDGTEVKLGEGRAVRGQDQNQALCAFLVHPLSYDDVWQPRSQHWLRYVLNNFVKPGILPERWLKRMFLSVRPQFQGLIEGVTLQDGRQLRVMLISAPLMPDQFRSNPDDALRMAIQGARFAHQLGAEVVGLGAFWSTVGDKGREVQEAVPEIVVTNGGAYTAATVRAAVPGLLKRFKSQGGTLKSATAAIVGANGVVAFGVARMIVGEVGSLILIGRDRERLNRSAATLRKKYPTTDIIATTDIATVASADLIFTATSDPRPLIFAQDVKPGAWIFDLGRPADVDESVKEVPGVELVPGGVVRPPGDMRTRIDLRFGEGFVPACLAETMILTASKAYERRSLGASTRTADIDFYLREGERLGFEIVTRDARFEGTKVNA